MKSSVNSLRLETGQVWKQDDKVQSCRSGKMCEYLAQPEYITELTSRTRVIKPNEHMKDYSKIWYYPSGTSGELVDLEENTPRAANSINTRELSSANEGAALASQPNEITVDGVNYKLFTWENIKHEPKERKQKFQTIRMKVMEKLMEDQDKDFKINWDSSGSTSPDSDLDITLVPDLVPTKDASFFSNYYKKIIDRYSSYFELPMEKMFDMNIYASPFFYVHNNEIELAGRCATNVRWEDIAVESVKGSYKSLSYLCVSPQEIIEHQYPYAQGKKTAFQGDKTRLYCTELDNYTRAVFVSNNAHDDPTLTALESLSRSTLYVEEAYHTQGAVLHVNCPQEFREACYNNMHAQYFVCSMYENLRCAREKATNGNYDKAIKYACRYYEAKLIVIIKLIKKLSQPSPAVSTPPRTQTTAICPLSEWQAVFDQLQQSGKYVVLDTDNKIKIDDDKNPIYKCPQVTARPDGGPCSSLPAMCNKPGSYNSIYCSTYTFYNQAFELNKKRQNGELVEKEAKQFITEKITDIEQMLEDIPNSSLLLDNDKTSCTSISCCCDRSSINGGPSTPPIPRPPLRKWNTCKPVRS